MEMFPHWRENIDVKKSLTASQKKQLVQKLKIGVYMYFNNGSINSVSEEFAPLEMQNRFLEEHYDVIDTVIKVRHSRECTIAGIRELVCSQGVLRTGFWEEKNCFVELSYTPRWCVPSIDLSQVECGMEYLGNTYQKMIGKLNFIRQGQLLSNIVVIQVEEKLCYVLLAVHHAIWDGRSSELFEKMLVNILRNPDTKALPGRKALFAKHLDNQFFICQNTHNGINMKKR